MSKETIKRIYKTLKGSSPGLGMCGVSVNTESTDTFDTDTDATETPMFKCTLITETLPAPTLMPLEHRCSSVH